MQTPALRYFFCILCFIGTGTLFAQSFKEISGEAGITHHCYDVNLYGGGIAFFDFNNDGWDDLYLTGGGLPDKLYENLGHGAFVDVTEQSGIGQLSNLHTIGVYAADLDNDGYIDLFVSTSAHDACYVLWNQAGHSFELEGAAAGLTEQFLGTSIAVGDYDLDGDLDVYVGNYRPVDPDVFYQNNGDRTFTNISAQTIADDGKGAA